MHIENIYVYREREVMNPFRISGCMHIYAMNDSAGNLRNLGCINI